MCGHNSNRQYNQCQGDPNIALLVGLCKKAYNKRQAKKLLKAEQANLDRERSLSPEKLEQNANAEILEKADIPPPSYDSVVANRAMAPSSNVDMREKGENMKPSFATSEYVADGMRAPPVKRRAPAPISFMPQTRQGGCHSRQTASESTCAQKKAEKAARKEAKAAAKAAAKEMRVM